MTAANNKIAAILIFVLLFCAVVTSKPKPPPAFRYVPGQLLVKFKHPVQNRYIESVRTRLSAEKAVPLLDRHQLFSHADSPILQIYKFTAPGRADMVRPAQRIAALPYVRWAEPNYLLPVQSVPNDSLFAELFFLSQIFAPEAWDICRGDSSVIISIVDTGVDLQHPDLTPSLWRNDETENGEDSDGNGYVDDVHGWDFVDNTTDAAYGEDGQTPDNDPSDFDGHGTFVAGLAAAATDNLIGTSAISWGCRLMPLRAGYKSTSGGYILLDAAAKAFIYAADNGAHVINFSTSSGHVLVEAARYAFSRGVVIVKSAGNDRSSQPDPLELEPFVINVSAVDDRDYKASYADYGEWVSVCAPGGDLNSGRPGLISTTMYGGYTEQQGTSFAAPVVAGLAGLIKSFAPGKSAADIVFQITGTADEIDHLNPAYRGQLGSGRINALRALQETVTESPELTFVKYDVFDQSGNQNSALDPGETVELAVTLRNSRAPAHNVALELSIDHAAVSMQKSTALVPKIAGIENIYHSTAGNNGDPFVISANGNALPQRVPAKLRVTEQNGGRWDFDFFIPLYPTILLVDDDDGTVNVETYYEQALDSLGLACLRWDHQQRGHPAGPMKQWDNVIWFCEQTGSLTPTLDSLDRTIVADYLDGGGNLFLSGQDIGWDLAADPGINYVNQFILSLGASWDFYRHYLHAQYLLDASVYMFMYGADNDPIGDSLVFRFGQPGRSYQFPSEILPLDDAVSVFDYPNNKSGAVRYGGTERLVYFAFGGLEAVQDAKIRPLVLRRILNWMNGIKTVHSPQRDVTTDSAGMNFVFQVQTERQPVAAVRLYTRSHVDEDYRITAMQGRGDTLFSATVPLPDHAAVEYAFTCTLENGFVAPVDRYDLFLTGDTSDVEFENRTRSSICSENIRFIAQLASESPLDSSQIFSVYRRPGSAADSLLMVRQDGNLFASESPVVFTPGDTVLYYYSVRKKAWPYLTYMSPPDTLVAGREGFEYGTECWQQGPACWTVDSTGVHRDGFCLSTSFPIDSCFLTLTCAQDLSRLENPAVTFYTRHHMLDGGAAGKLQIKPEGRDRWLDAGPVISGSSPGWYRVWVPLDAFSGQKINLRFTARRQNPAGGPKAFWKLDDILFTGRRQVLVKEQNFTPPAPGPVNFPNPFNAATDIFYSLSRSGRIRLYIYDIRGRRIRKLVDQWQAPGRYSIAWDGRDPSGAVCPTGVYFIRLQDRERYYFKKMLLLR